MSNGHEFYSKLRKHADGYSEGHDRGDISFNLVFLFIGGEGHATVYA